jgi:HTH-type transcriptional regulator / antitoxin HigA
MTAQLMKEITKHFQALRAVVPLHPIRTLADYDAAVEAMNQLLDAGATDENHALADLAATLGELIGDYDDAHYPIKNSSPTGMLRFLMEQHGLKQNQLPEVGSQGVVSEVLANKRELNVRQIKALAKRFGVSPAVFV